MSALRIPRDPRRPRIPEKTEQAHIVQLLRSLGGQVFVFGTHRRATDYHGTMQTAGIPDLVCFLPVKRRGTDLQPGPRFEQVFVECKAAGGRLRPEQIVFRELCLAAQILHVVGGLDDVIAFLVERDFVKSEQFAHYRQPSSAKELQP